MKQSAKTKQQCEKIYKTLINRGYIISSQRKVLIEALCEQRKIKNIEAFWMDLRLSHGISWATVYSNMRLLIEIGLVMKEGHKHVMDVCYRLNSNETEN